MVRQVGGRGQESWGQAGVVRATASGGRATPFGPRAGRGSSPRTCESHDQHARASIRHASCSKLPPRAKTCTLACIRAMSIGETSAKSCEKAGLALKMKALWMSSG